jgi:hypothetical protein
MAASRFDPTETWGGSRLLQRKKHGEYPGDISLLRKAARNHNYYPASRKPSKERAAPLIG